MPLPVVDPACYEAQLAEKIDRFVADAAPLAPPRPTVFRSPPIHYRLRAEFRIWHDGAELDYVMFDPDAPDVPIKLDQFPAGSATINRLMPALKERLRVEPALRRKLFQIEFLTTLSGEALVTLLYHRRLDDDWRHAARQLARSLDIQLIGRARRQKETFERDWVLEEFTIDSRRLSYKQVENSFTQPNGHINQAMLGWARDQLPPSDSDLLELYCGNGNFTVALADRFRRVLATEISKTSTAAAEFNANCNGVNNVALIRMSSDEISTALSGGRAFRRLAGIDLPSYRFNTLLVDPPRSGLDPVTLALARGFDRILYISCSPATLLGNLQSLAATHQIAALALFDQFPYTHHLECGVLLQRRTGV